MALKLNERYPGRFTNPSGDYPQGSFKNRSTPTAKDGSYLEKDWANDKEGFFQSLISSAGIVVNGLVDKVGASQYLDALVAVIKATSIPWSKVTNRPTTVSGYGITDAMPTSGGPYTPSFYSLRIDQNAAVVNQRGGYINYGAGDDGLTNAIGFICNRDTGAGGFTWRSVNAGNTQSGPVMSYSYAGRLTVPMELYVPAIPSNTVVPTQSAGYAGAYIANCAFVANAIGASVIGYGQSWQDLTAARVASTTYTNSTGRAIQISVYPTASQNGTITITVGGVVVATHTYNNQQAGAQYTATAIVPVGASYSVSIIGSTIGKWLELR